MNVQDLLQDYDAGMKNKLQWHNLWQDLADVLLPKRADIVTKQTDGADRHNTIYDSTPIRSCRALANAIDSLLKPKTSDWFGIIASNPDLNDMDDVKRWFEVVQERMWNAIYAKNARFVQRSGETDRDLAALGTGCLFIGENKDLNGLMFRSIHPKDIVIFENSDGVVDKVYVRQNFTPRQAMQAYGEDNLGDATKQKLRSDPSCQETSEFVICVFPRNERDYKSSTAKDLPFAKVVIDKASEHIVEESGYHEFPLAVPRWETASGEVYGRSPGMVALADSKTLQAMQKTLLVGGQKAVDPPMAAIDDAIIGAVRTFPGGMTTIDGDAARAAGMFPIQPLDMGKNIPLGREMQNDTRLAVEAAFFKNIFNLPMDGPQMTATEVIQRKEEFIREIGPVFSQLQTDYIGHIVERVFGIMFRAGAFPEPPEILQGRDIEFQFQSPVQLARKQIDAVSAARALELLGPFVQADPAIMDNFDGDAIVRDTPDTFGIPMGWLRTKEDRDALRKRRAQAQQEQAQLMQAQQQSETLKNVASIEG